jgi:biopolymer transport protein ExbD
MRFRQQRQPGIPEINLIPMLNVMMGILAFFALITMSLTVQQTVEVPLPNPDLTPPPDTEPPPPLIVTLDAQGILQANGDRMEAAELQRRILRYLDQQPQGTIILQADAQQPYQAVLTLLETMKATGGDRVTLAID